MPSIDKIYLYENFSLQKNLKLRKKIKKNIKRLKAKKINCNSLKYRKFISTKTRRFEKIFVKR